MHLFCFMMDLQTYVDDAWCENIKNVLASGSHNNKTLLKIRSFQCYLIFYNMEVV